MYGLYRGRFRIKTLLNLLLTLQKWFLPFWEFEVERLRDSNLFYCVYLHFSKISFDNVCFFLETEKDAKDLNKCSKSSSSIKRKTLPNYSKNHLKKVVRSSVDSRVSTEKSEKSDFRKKSSRKRTKNLLNMSLVPSAPPLYPRLPEVDPETGLSQLFSSIYCQNSKGNTVFVEIWIL